jgi:hypothetical protein
MLSNVDYHLHRARVERDTAYRSADSCVSNVHMRLSALHLQRAMLLQDVQRQPVGNVSPFRVSGEEALSPVASAACDRVVQLPSSLAPAS